MRRVVVTGIGVYASIGKNVEEVSESLKAGKSGIIYHPILKEMGFRSALMGGIETPNLKGILGRRDRIGLSQQAMFAYVSTKEALEKAGLTEDYFIENEAGIIFGNDSSSKAVMEAIDLIREKKDTTLIGSGSIFQSMNCTVTMNLSTIFKLRGINFTVSGACASGSHAIGMGYQFIRSGQQDMVICGGAQEVNEYAFGNFDGIGAFSVREDEPTRASRPFDARRDGLVPGGGAATVILESYESAKARGAKIYGEIIGYGFSSNGEHISNPSKEGQITSLNRALNDADLKPADIDYINAHATSTQAGDGVEAKALEELFGKLATPVSSTKSMTGHECWMAGASEIVYSIIMMNEGFIAPNINFETPDENTKGINIINKYKEQPLNTILSNSFGFGGTNSTLIVTKAN